VLLWAQTTRAARVKFAYWEEATPKDRHETAEKTTAKNEAFIAKLVADEVEPGRRYGYEILIDGVRVERPYPLRFQTKPAMRFRSDPFPLKIAAGSCFYANDATIRKAGTGRRQQHLRVDARAGADLMLWLGDNVYTRDIDWTRTGLVQRWGFTRAVKELQPLLGSVHHYSIWDDHDYGRRRRPELSRQGLSREVFQLFWGNPKSGADPDRGIAYRFTWGDAEFFLLDDRWNRSPNMRSTGKRQILGAAQIEWLLDSLASSGATFKFVVMGGQILNTARVAETYANYPEERAKLLEEIGALGLRGVMFLTGDRHFSELSKLERPGSYPLYDFTMSPLTVSPSNGEREGNTLRVPETYVQERSFGMVEIGGPFGDRRSRCRCVTRRASCMDAGRTAAGAARTRG
jgi:alkaline phosphatase D